MATPAELVITIAARDQATQVLRDTQARVKATGDEMNQTFKGMSGAVDGLRGAFDKLGGAIPGIGGSLRALSSIMTTSVAGAVTGLVGAVASYGIALNRVADDQLRFQRALHSLDANTIRGELSSINDELNRMSDIGNKIGKGGFLGGLQSDIARFQATIQGAREIFLGEQTPEARRAEAIKILGGVLGVQEGIKQTGLLASIADTRQREILFEMQKRLNEGDLAGARSLLPQFDVADRREEELAVRKLRTEQELRRSALLKEGLPTDEVEKTFALEEQDLRAKLGIDLQRQRIARGEQIKAVALDQETRPLDATKKENDALAAQYSALQQLAQLEAARAEQFGQLDVLNEKLAEVTTNYVRQAGAARDALEAAQAIERIQAQSKNLPTDENSELGRRQAAELRAFDLRQNAGLAQIQSTSRTSRDRLLQRQFIEGQVESGQGFESAVAGLMPEDVARGGATFRKAEAERVALEREALAIQQQIVDVQRQRSDLNQHDRDLLEIETSARREQLQLASLALERDIAQGDAAKALIDSQAELVKQREAIYRHVVETQRLEREDPVAGLQRGFRDIADAGANAGDRIRTELVSSFHDVSQSFTDIVIDGIYNKAENASEIGRQLGKKLLTGFVDQLTTGLTSRAFGAIQQVLGLGPSGTTGGRVLSAVPLVASPFTGGGEGAVQSASGSGVGGGGILGTVYSAFSGTGGAAASPATATRGIRPSGAASSPATAGSGTFDLGGIGQFAQGFFGPSLSLVDIAGAYGAGGFAGVAEAQSLVAAGLTGEQAVAVVAVEASGVGAAEGTAAGVGVVADAGVGGSSLTGAGSAAFGIAGGVLSAAALAYTAYSAYQSGDVVGGAIGGAISGAALGTVIYPGIGTVVGLIAGAAIGAGAGGAGKEEQEVKNDRRRNEADRQRRGAWIYQDLMTAINSGADQEDVAEQTVRTGHSVGQLLMGVATLNQAGALRDAPWGWAPSTNAEKTQKILAGFGYAPLLDFQWDRLNSTMELIASWHQPRGITEGDVEISKNAEALMAAFVNKSGATVLLGYDEQFATGLRGAAGRLTRETLLLSSRAREAAGRDLFVVGNTLDNLDDDQAQRILERLARVDRDRDLQIIRVESDFGATVTVGNRTPLLPPPPDPGTLIGERNIPQVFPSYSPYVLFADPSTNSSTL